MEDYTVINNEEFLKSDEIEIVYEYLIRERGPYVVNMTKPLLPEFGECSGCPIKNFAKPLPIENSMVELTYEHSGAYVNPEHNQHKNLNEITKLFLVKFNDKKWCAHTYGNVCLKIDEQNKIHILNTSLGCHPNDINWYKENIIVSCQTINIDCLVINCPWSDGFQHSIQDLFPRIYAVKDWLLENKNITIVCYENPDLAWLIKTYLPTIQNNVMYVKSNIVHTTGNLYTLIQNPLHKCEMVPYGLYCNLGIIHKGAEDKYIIIFDRSSCKDRIMDTNKIVDVVKPFCEKYGLELKVINPSVYSKNEIINIMKNTMGVIAPHGGANYNVLFMRRSEQVVDKKRFFIEFIVQNGVHHTYHIALGAKIRYKAIVCENANHFDCLMDFNPTYLTNVLTKFMS